MRVQEQKKKNEVMGLKPQDAYKEAWNQVIYDLWQTRHVHYYKCETFLFSAFMEDNSEDIKEIMELARIIAGKEEPNADL